MGDVYRAVDREGGAAAAVKILRAEYLTDDAMRRRFRREGAVLRALDHSGIVKLLEFGVDDDGLVYLVTEYVEGETLRERIQVGALEPEAVDTLLMPLCDAVGAAHAHGVIHGDLKPDNVVLVEGAPRLLDFGASKVLGLDRLTATGEVAGTPAYMAPELFAGKAEVDARIDVYGFGVVLYEALSGGQPFYEGHVGRSLLRIAAGDCLPLHTVSDTSAALSAVVHRAMHHDHESRYRTMGELTDAWHAARGDAS